MTNMVHHMNIIGLNDMLEAIFMFAVVEPLEVLAMAYCAYLVAELFHFSGIIRYVLFHIILFYSMSRSRFYQEIV